MTTLPPSDVALVWLQRAQSDLNLAQVAFETQGVMLEDACFHAQQCAEKALKALLLTLRIDFPRTHAIAVLLHLLREAPIDVPDNIGEAFLLSQYAVETRYPGEWEPVTAEETQTALRLATEVFVWAKTAIVLQRTRRE